MTSFGAASTTASFFKTVEADALVLNEWNAGTIANAGTATLVLGTNVSRATYSGATATIALPAITVTTNSYQLIHFGTNTSGGAQIITIPSLLRDELCGTCLVTTITNNSGAGFTIVFDSVNGAWSRVAARGDALSFPLSSTGNMNASGTTNSYAIGNISANGGIFTNSLSLAGTVKTNWSEVGGVPGGAALSIQYNSNSVFSGFGSFSNDTQIALIPNVIVQTNIYVLGNTNGSVLLYDGDGNAYTRIAAAPVISTNAVINLPIEPNVGALAGTALTLGTNLVTEFVGAPLSVYAAGTAYSLTATSAALDFGTTDPVLPISHAGTYLIIGRTVVRYNAATFVANQTLTLKLRRTNNTAADVSNSTGAYTTDITTTRTANFVQIGFAPVVYTTANADDSLTIFGDISVVPSAGSLDVTAASILAIRLY